MNQNFWSSFTVALLLATLSPVATCIGQAEAVDPVSPANSQPSETLSPTVLNTNPETSAFTSANSQLASTEVAKVGEHQTEAIAVTEDEVVARIQPHEVEGRQAATLYVRDIPVLTFLGARPNSASGTKMGETKASTTAATSAQSKAEVRAEANNQNDPVWRATEVAAKINQLNRDGADANTITVSWDGASESTKPAGDRYAIKVDGSVLVLLDAETILPDTTRDSAQDALQATNRLRRLLGSAPPLREIADLPKAIQKSQQVSLGPVQVRISGWASWYGPGFDGNQSASGEIFNQNAMTAAHRDLPFGTKVRVTNLDNGRAVIVRINDRGPYVHDRIIDLSAGAARTLGLIQSGVAPVRLEVLGPQQTASAN